MAAVSFEMTVVVDHGMLPPHADTIFPVTCSHALMDYIQNKQFRAMAILLLYAAVDGQTRFSILSARSVEQYAQSTSRPTSQRIPGKHCSAKKTTCT